MNGKKTDKAVFIDVYCSLPLPENATAHPLYLSIDNAQKFAKAELMSVDVSKTNKLMIHANCFSKILAFSPLHWFMMQMERVC